MIKELFEVVPDYIQLAAKDKTECDLLGWHGVGHWERVGHMGAYLATITPGANIKVILYFAYLHDCCRIDEGHDREHGKRAAEFISEFHTFLNQTEFDQLSFAIEHHSSARTITDPTIGCCWDADRLDLTRLGIVPDHQFMSTEAGIMVAKKIAEAA